MWIGKAFHQLNGVTTLPTLPAPSTRGGGALGQTPPNYVMNPFDPPPSIETLDASAPFTAANFKMLGTNQGALSDKLQSAILPISDDSVHIFQAGKDVIPRRLPQQKNTSTSGLSLTMNMQISKNQIINTTHCKQGIQQ